MHSFLPIRTCGICIMWCCCEKSHKMQIEFCLMTFFTVLSTIDFMRAQQYPEDQKVQLKKVPLSVPARKCWERSWPTGSSNYNCVITSKVLKLFSGIGQRKNPLEEGNENELFHLKDVYIKQRHGVRDYIKVMCMDLMSGRHFLF